MAVQFFSANSYLVCRKKEKVIFAKNIEIWI